MRVCLPTSTVIPTPVFLLKIVGCLALLGSAAGTIGRQYATPSLGDLRSFYAAGQAVLIGADPYGQPVADGLAPNLNPPASLLLFEELARFPFDQVTTWWWIASLASYVGVIAALVFVQRPPYWPAWVAWAAVIDPLWNTLYWGQIYLLLLALAAAALLLLRRHPIWSGLALGLLVALKPNFLAWAGLMVLTGRRATGLSAIAVASAIAVLPALRYEAEIYARWQAVTPAILESAEDTVRHLEWGSGSLIALAHYVRAPSAGILAAGVVAAASAVFALRYRDEPLRVCAIGLACSLLSSPIAWEGYEVILLPALLGLPRRWISVGPLILMSVPFVNAVDALLPELPQGLLTFGVYALALLAACTQVRTESGGLLEKDTGSARSSSSLPTSSFTSGADRLHGLLRSDG